MEHICIILGCGDIGTIYTTNVLGNFMLKGYVCEDCAKQLEIGKYVDLSTKHEFVKQTMH